MDMLEKIKHAAAFIDGRTSGFRPEVGIILGTGLGGLVDHIAIRHSIEYADIPDFPVSTVEGHKGRLIFGELGGRRIVAMQGRFHYYEGYTPQQVVFPVRVMKFLGIARLVENGLESQRNRAAVGIVGKSVTPASILKKPSYGATPSRHVPCRAAFQLTDNGERGG